MRRGIRPSCTVLLILAGLVATANVLAGCGGSSTSSSATAPPTPVATTTTITGSLATASSVGQGYAVTVSVAPSSGSGAPTGTVLVQDGAGASCTVTLTPGSPSTGSCMLTSASAGNKTIVAGYSGDSNFLASTSAGVAHSVNPATQPAAIISPASEAFTIANAGTFTVAATGTPTPKLTETGALPSGLTFTDNGNGTATLTGTPASGTSGTYSLMFTANNGVGSNATQNFSLGVNGNFGFVTNNIGGNVTVIDLTANAATGQTVSLSAGATPEGIAINPIDTLFAYVANGASKDVQVFCTRVEGAICPSQFGSPTIGGAVKAASADHAHVADSTGANPAPFSNTTDVVIASTGLFGFVVDNGAGMVYKIDTNRASATFNQILGAGISIPGAARADIHPAADFVYVADGKAEIVAINTSTGAITTIPISVAGTTSYAVAASPDGNSVYVTDPGNGQVHAIDSSSLPGTYVASTPAAGAGGGLMAGAKPHGIRFTPDNRLVYVTDNANSLAAAIDPYTLNTAIATPGVVLVTNNAISLSATLTGTSPEGIELTSDGKKAFVTDNASSSTTAIDANFSNATFQTPVLTFAGQGNFSGAFAVANIPDPLLHIPDPLPDGLVATPYSGSIPAAGGYPPFLFSVSGGSLPPGLSIDNHGRVSGTPTQPGTFTFTVTVSDTEGQSKSSSRTIQIQSLSLNPLPQGTVNVSYGQAITIAGMGRNLPLLIAALDGSCNGLFLGATGGFINGTPKVAGLCTFRISIYYGKTSVGGNVASVTINKDSSVTTLSVSNGSQPCGPETINLTAVVKAGDAGPAVPTGQVQFIVDNADVGAPVSLSGTPPTALSLPLTLAIGSHTLQENYLGDGNFLVSSAPSSLAIQPCSTQPTTTNVVVSPNPAIINKPITLTGTVVPTSSSSLIPTGSMVFNLVPSTGPLITLGTATLGANGAASLTTTSSSLVLGANTFNAVYGGDSNFAGSTGTTTATVTQQPTITVSAVPNPQFFGQPVVLTATVPGSATLTMPSVQFTAVSASGAQIVLGNASVGANGMASLTVSNLPLGTNTITAQGTNFSNTPGTTTVTINPANTSITGSTSPTTPTYSKPVVLNVTINGFSQSNLPQGTISLYLLPDHPSPGTDCSHLNGSLLLGQQTTSNGGSVQVLSQAPIPAGTHMILMCYTGDPANLPSTGTFPVTVNQGSTTVNVTPLGGPPGVGQTVTYSATVLGDPPTGTLIFYDASSGATCSVLGSSVLLGSNGLDNTGATSVGPFGFASAGTHTILVCYGGDSNFTGTSTTFMQTVNKANTASAVIAFPNSVDVGQGITFTANISAVAPSLGGSITGTVTFTIDGVAGSPISLSSGGSLNTSSLTAGTHIVTVAYSGDSNFNPSDSTGSPFTVTVNPALATIARTPFGQLPDALQGFPYAQTQDVIGGTAPLTFSVSSADFTNNVGNAGTACQGLSVSSTTGAITGTPSILGTCGSSGFITVNDAVNGPPVLAGLNITVRKRQAYIAGPGGATPTSGDDSVEVIDTGAKSFIASIDATAPGRKPAGIAATRNGRLAVVNLNAIAQPFVNSSMLAIDTTTNTVLTGQRILFTSCLAPAGVAIGTVPVATITTISRASDGVAVTTAAPHGLAIQDLVSISGVGDTSFDGTFLITNVTATTFTYSQIAPDSTSTGGTASAEHAYVGCSNSEIGLIDVSANSGIPLDVTPASLTNIGATAMPPVTPSFDGVAITPNGSQVFAVDSTDGDFFVVATSTNAVTGPFTLCTNPKGIAITPAGDRAYVACDSNTIAVINTATNAVSTITTVNMTATDNWNDLAITPDGTRVYVTAANTGDFTVIDNTVATPAAIPAAPIAITNGALQGIAIPALSPIPGSGVQVFIADSTTSPTTVSNVDVRDDSPILFPTDVTPVISLTAGALNPAPGAPIGFAAVPVPYLFIASSGLLPTPSASTAYSSTPLAAHGGVGAFSWSATFTGAACGSLTINGNTGVVSGTPGTTGSGTCTIGITVTDAIVQQATAQISFVL